MIAKNDKRVINGWAMYDWANSVYALTITTAIFPIYYKGIIEGANGDNVAFFGATFNGDALFAFVTSFGFIFLAFVSPILSAIADYSGKKKEFMQFFCYMGSISCALMFFFTKETFELSMILSEFALIGFAGSLVFYNAYLPEIATEDQFDIISAKGFSLGYIGSVLLLTINLIAEFLSQLIK